MAAANSTVASTSTATSGTCEIQEIDPFVRFDVVCDHSDHAYAHLKGQFPSQAQKKIMLEWKILKKDLPESIAVRAYEQRIDLLRAVIVGADGTPYHDGLYFFDLAFPTDYPWQPPWVYYRSFGYRINPNLYANGKVCLSLLNTWPGSKSEKWNHKESTVLQILLSLQALVLNERPYCNEPGFGGFIGRILLEKRSLSYNGEIFLRSCKTMLCLVRRPPKGFEGFVASHFQERARTILGACEAYVNGQALVGHFKSSGSSCSGGGSSSKVAAMGSQKFRASLRALYPQLYTAFRLKGALLHGIKKDLQVQQATSSEPESGQASTKKISGLRDKIIRKIKKMLGLKNEKKKMVADDANLQRRAKVHRS